MKLVSQREFAALACVAPATISNAANSGTLRHAKSGTKIDVEHPEALKYIEDRIKNHYMKPKRGRPQLDKAMAPAPAQNLDERYQQKLNEMSQDIKGVLDKPLGEIIYWFGDDFRFVEWLKAVKEMETIEAKKIKNEMARGELVRRDLVHVGIFMTIDATFRQILGDASKTIANKTVAMVKSGSEQDEIVKYVRDILGSFLNGCVQKMERCMKDI